MSKITKNYISKIHLLIYNNLLKNLNKPLRKSVSVPFKLYFSIVVQKKLVKILFTMVANEMSMSDSLKKFLPYIFFLNIFS